MNIEQRLPRSRPALRILSPIQAFVKFFQTMMLWQKRIEERRHLLELSNETLRDVGLTRDELMREIAKPFWRE